MGARPWIVLVLALWVSSCFASSEIDPLSGLSESNADAYVLIADLLENQVAPGMNFCVAVVTSKETKSVRAEPQLIERLQNHLAPRLNATFVAMNDCRKRDAGWGMAGPSGEAAFPLRVSYSPDIPAERGNWMATYACGPLCGGGYFYSIDRTRSRPIAKRVGSIHF